jgi:cytochrome c553
MHLALLLLPVSLCHVAGLHSSSGPAGAAPQERDGGQAFEALRRRLDLDLDGKVSEAEFPRGKAAFRRLDRDRDGFLTAADFARRTGSDTPAPAAETPTATRPATAEEAEFFEKHVRPVLATACASCHGDVPTKLKGGLRVDSLAALLTGGVTGPALVPGDPDASLMIQAIRHDDASFAMPPKQKLDDNAVRNLERWVAMGAPWPASPSPDVSEPGEDAAPAEGSVFGTSPDGVGGLDREIDFEAGKQFWSFRPVVRPAAPTTKDNQWAWSDIDRFLLASMEARGVGPVADADRRTWLRRITFDLTGLPPTPEEAVAFEADRSSDAFAKVVDRLLASSAFGERFGRHWLDVARYGESSGKDSNVIYPHAWRYRDWVIDAVNQDMPYDEFLTKQLAGDLLPAQSDDERAWNQIATGYLALGTKGHNERDVRKFSLDVVDEQIDAVSQGMLGVTLSCARCHDHKFDPFPIEDYYAVAGIFLSSDTRFGTLRAPGNNQAAGLIELPREAHVPNGPLMEPALRQFLERGRTRAQSEADKAREERMSGDGERPTGADAFRERAQREQAALLADLMARFDERGNPLPSNRLAMGMAEGKPRDIAVLERGELDKPGAIAPRGVPQVLRTASTPTIHEGSGRRELAAWIASPENPLTARVHVNRIWLHLFGTGLVRTPDNFGAGGIAPDHPMLLDWLASEFVARGWSTKQLVRQLVLTHAYRLDSKHDKRHDALDPEALTRWRMPERRLEAEAIRDALLATSGALQAKPPVGSPTGALEGPLRREEFAQLLTRERPVRSVYLPSLRGHVVDALEVFDAPDAAFVTGDREETSVATQALFMMNDADVLRYADQFADRLLALSGDDDTRIRRAFELAFGRAPESREASAVKAFLAEYARTVEPGNTDKRGGSDERASDRRQRPGQGPGQEPRRRGARAGAPGAEPPVEPITDPRRAAWSAFAQSLFQSAEFRTIG